MPKRRRVHRGGRPKRHVENIPPTPQTAAKLRPDVLTKLCRERIIDRDQEAAAWEILKVWQAMMRGFFPLMKMESERERSTGTVRDCFARMSSSERFYWENHYRPWAQREEKKLAVKFPRVTLFQLALAVIVENEDPAELATQYNVSHETLMRDLRATLNVYSMFQRKEYFHDRSVYDPVVKNTGT